MLIKHSFIILIQALLSWYGDLMLEINFSQSVIHLKVIFVVNAFWYLKNPLTWSSFSILFRKANHLWMQYSMRQSTLLRVMKEWMEKRKNYLTDYTILFSPMWVSHLLYSQISLPMPAFYRQDNKFTLLLNANLPPCLALQETKELVLWNLLLFRGIHLSL